MITKNSKIATASSLATLIPILVASFMSLRVKFCDRSSNISFLTALKITKLDREEEGERRRGEEEEEGERVYLSWVRDLQQRLRVPWN